MYQQERMKMVREQVQARGIIESPLLTAMRLVPRELFVPENEQNHAYEDAPIPLGFNQIMSPPYLVAKMLELADASPSKTLLEVNSGSGYLVAVASFLFKEVVGIESVPELLEKSKKLLDILCISRAQLFSEEALVELSKRKFDAIIVSGSLSEIPKPLLSLLAPLGRLVVPVQKKKLLDLVCLQRQGEKEDFKQL